MPSATTRDLYPILSSARHRLQQAQLGLLAMALSLGGAAQRNAAWHCRSQTQPGVGLLAIGQVVVEAARSNATRPHRLRTNQGTLAVSRGSCGQEHGSSQSKQAKAPLDTDLDGTVDYG